MNRHLQLLIDLQGVESQIQRLEKEEAKIPLQINELQSISDARQHEYKTKVQSVQGIEKEKRKKEGELESQESSLAKLKNQLLSVKTNREYQALLHEIENIQKDVSQLEEDILLLIEESESIARGVKEANIELKKSEERFIEQKKEKEHELTLFHQQKKGLESRKEAIQKEIPDELLKKYDRIKRNRNGVGVAAVKDASCQGCFMNLMPQLFQEIKQNDQIYCCPNCQRIVYYDAGTAQEKGTVQNKEQEKQIVQNKEIAQDTETD